MRLRRRETGLELTVHEQPPDLLEGDRAHELLDVDAAVAQRAAFLVGLGDLGGKGDDALEPSLVATAMFDPSVLSRWSCAPRHGARTST
jgi:hypothetical protein